jgi:hypothetical protein
MSRLREPDLRAQALGVLAAGGIVLVTGVSVLIAVLMVAGATGTGDSAVRVPSTAKASAAVSATATLVVASATPTAAAATLSPSPAPTPPITVSSYRSGGHSYAGIAALPGTVLLAPFDGTIQVRLYQYINGEVRVGSSVPSLPFFPYVTLVSADRRLTFRPGALGADTEVLVRDSERVSAGTPLFRVIGAGRSSWATFYDVTSPFQVIASLQALPSGLDLDPLIGYLAD